MMSEPTAPSGVSLHSLENGQAFSGWGQLQIKAMQIPSTLWMLFRYSFYPFCISTHDKPLENNVPYCSMFCRVEVKSSWATSEPIVTARQQIQIMVHSFFILRHRFTGHFRGPSRTSLAGLLLVLISPETVNIIQTMALAQRKKSIKILNILKIGLLQNFVLALKITTIKLNTVHILQPHRKIPQLLLALEFHMSLSHRGRKKEFEEQIWGKYLGQDLTASFCISFF